MSKNKVSEWSSTPANNTDVGGIDIAEGCAPSGINNAIREMMAQLKDQQSGTDADNFTVGGTLTLSADLISNGSSGTAGQFLTSRGSGLSPQYTTLTAFVSGMIMLWSGSSGSIPSGWLLCDGSSSTPDLRNRFVVGAGSTYAVGATGGSADAIVVSHTHTGTTSTASLTGTLNATSQSNTVGTVSASGIVTATNVVNSFVSGSGGGTANSRADYSINASHNHSFTTDSAGASGTNANLPPYYALCYIMKS
jgi:hypothetical protein